MFKSKEIYKCYILLFTWATARCVQIELVTGFHATLLYLKRFTSRGGKSNLFNSNNFKTFKPKEVNY